MESINVFKGYGKVATNPKSNPLEDHQQNPNPHRRRRLIAISGLLLVTLLVGLALVALLLDSITESSESPPLSSNSAESTLKIVCNVTRYPDSCLASITTALNGSPEPDPESILKISMEVAGAEVARLATELKAMHSNSGESALSDCREQVEDAVSRLGESESAIGKGAKVTETKMKDAQTWIGGALTDLDTCLDGLEEVGSTVLDEVKMKMNKSNEYTSNALAIVANFQSILDKLHKPL